MKNLNFSQNWNRKLSNECFSTIRIWQPEVYKEGEQYKVWWQHQFRGIAELVSANQFEIAKLTEGMARLDTAYSSGECRGIMRKMYPEYIKKYGDRALFGFYIFKYINPQLQLPMIN